MNRTIRLLLTITAIVISGSGYTVQGQNAGNTPNDNAEMQRRNQQVTENLANLRKMEAEAKQDAVQKPQMYPAKDREKYITLREKELLQEDASKLKPAQHYFIQFAEFLKNKNAGIARLFPDMKCYQGLTVNISEIERCTGFLQIRGGGSFYSFRNRTNINESGTWADLHLIDGKFVVGSKNQFSLIRELREDVSLDDLKAKSDEVKFLLNYKPKFRLQDVKLEKEILEKGQINEFSSSANLKLNSTYILRSIAYQRKIVDPFDHRADIIVAFRVIAQEDDGSIILLWKQLKSKTPKKLKEEFIK